MATESVILQFKTTGIPAVNAQLIRMQTASQRIVSSLTGVKSLLGFIGGTVAFTKASKTIAEFEQTMANVQAVSGATKEEFEALEEVARNLGATTVFSAREAGQGLVFLSQAGFTATESIESLPQVLQLAQAGGLGLAESAKITANVIRGMNLAVSEGARINDVFARSASSSNVTVSSLGQSFSFVAPFANALNVSIEEASSAIGKLGDAGIVGGRSGRNLVAFFRQLAKITPEAERILAKYGLSAESVNVQTLGLSKVLRNLQPLIKNTGDTFRIFGAQGALVANILGNNVDGFDALNEKLNDAEGSAREMAKIMSNTLVGSFKAFISALTESTLQIGDAGLTGALTSLLKISAGVLSEFNGMGDLFKENTELSNSQTEAIEKITGAFRFLGERIGIVIDAFNEIASLGVPTLLAGIVGGITAINVGARGLQGTLISLRSTFLRFAPALIFVGVVETINQAGKALNDFTNTDISPLTASLNVLRATLLKLGQGLSNFLSRTDRSHKSWEDFYRTLNQEVQIKINDKALTTIQNSSFALLKTSAELRKEYDGLKGAFNSIKNPTQQQTQNFKELTKAYMEGQDASKRLSELQTELQKNVGNNTAFLKLRQEALELQQTVKGSDSAFNALKTTILSVAEESAPEVAKVKKEVEVLSSEISSGLAEGFRKAITEGTGFIGILDSVTNSINNVLESLLQSALEKQLLSLFTGGGGGVSSSGGLLGTLLETGAKATVGGGLSKVNPVNNIDRSLSKTVNNYYNQGLEKTGAPQVQIYDQRRNNSAPIQTQRSIDNEGNLRLKIMIKDEVNSAIQEGGLDSSFDSRYGVKPIGT